MDRLVFWDRGEKPVQLDRREQPGLWDRLEWEQQDRLDPKALLALLALPDLLDLLDLWALKDLWDLKDLWEHKHLVL